MNIVYKIFLLSCFLVSGPDINAKNLWTKQNSPTSVNLRNCSFIDPLNGWASGDDGVIIHTSDGGNTFVIQNSTINYYINDIFFINKRLGWSVANESFFEGSTILKTTDGGMNWNAENFPDSTKFLRTIFFLDSLNGFLAGSGGVIYKTTDAGITWLAAVIDSSEFSGFPIFKIRFADNNLGFACGGYMDVAGIIWRTTNGGLFWKAENQSPEPFYDLFIMDPLQIIAVGGDFEYGVQITKTSNSGVNWNYESLGIFGQAYSIDFRTEREAWMALGYSKSWAYSSDSGESWSSVPTIDNSIINSVDFVDSLHGWAVGNDGVILRYDPLISIVNSTGPNNDLTFTLFQNYPNPFNPKTIINYQLSMFNFITLEVYDVLGNTVASLVNENQNPGNHSIEFEGSNLSSGIYFYELKAGGNSMVKRMLLLK